MPNIHGFSKKEPRGWSDFGLQEIKKMKSLTLETLEEIRDGYQSDGRNVLLKTAQNEQKIDDMSEELRNAQIERMRNNLSSPEVGIIFSEMVTDFERIGDHALNIAEEYSRRSL